MKFHQHSGQSAEFYGIDPFLAEIIRQIPRAAQPEDDPAAKARLFSAPTHDDDELTRDWHDFVIPDLRLQFDSALSVVQRDLAENFVEGDGDDDFPFKLHVPQEHVDAWLSALNQARLVLAARHGFSDEELSGKFQPKLTSLRELALYQITIYGWMQELLLSTLA